jgi:hypothetical protein
VQEVLRSPSSRDGCRSGDGRAFYEVSDLGRVRSLPRKGGNNRLYGGRVLTPFRRKDRHIEVQLCRGNHRYMSAVHRLVLMSFIGPPPPGQEACHNNGQAADCRLGNLRWDTHAANMADMVIHGTSRTGERHWNARLTDDNVREIRRLWGSEGQPGHRHNRWSGHTWSQAALGQRFGVNRSAISQIVNGKTRAA